MKKILTLLAAVVTASGFAMAGQIELGGSTGLTSSYITSNGGSTGSWAEKNYDNRLFSQATSGGNMATPFNGYSRTGGETSGLTLTDSVNNVNFAMISDGCTGTAPNCLSNNLWEPSGTQAIIVPVGVLDVSDVWTMLNNNWGTPNAVDTTVTFDFGTSASGAIVQSVVVQLTNSSNNPGGPASGQIRTAIDCTSTTESPATCSTYATGPVATSSVINGVTVRTGNVYNSAYSAIAGTGYFANSSGNLELDDQGFIFGSAFANLYLVDVKIADASGVPVTSATALSAITVDSAVGASAPGTSTPEPSSIWLLVSGVTAVGFSRLRRK